MILYYWKMSYRIKHFEKVNSTNMKNLKPYGKVVKLIKKSWEGTGKPGTTSSLKRFEIQ